MPGAWEITSQRERRVLLAILCSTETQITVPFGDALRNLQLPPGSDILRVINLPRQAGQNQAALTARDSGYGYLGFLDLDIRVPPDAYLRLMESGLDLASGLYYQPHGQYLPYVLNLGRDAQGNWLPTQVTGWQMGSLVAVDLLPAGMLLVKRRVVERAFERFPLPFQWGADVALLPDVLPLASDFVFSWRCKTALGVQGFVHTGVVGLKQVRALVGPRWVVPMPSPDPLHGVVGVV